MQNPLKIPSSDDKGDVQLFALPPLLSYSEKIALSLYGDLHQRKREGAGESFWQFKPYEQGDDLRQIDWRQSAKSDRIFLKQREWEAPQTVSFSIDTSLGMSYKDKYYKSCVIALSLGMALIKAGENITLINALELGSGHSRNLYKKIAKILTTQRLNQPETHPYVLNLKKNSYCVFISDFLAPIEQTHQWLKQLKQKTNNVLAIQVLNADEVNLPFKGRIMFEDMTGTQKKDQQNIADIKDRYKEDILIHVKNVQALFKRYGYQYLFYRSDKNLEELIHKSWYVIAGK